MARYKRYERRVRRAYRRIFKRSLTCSRGVAKVIEEAYDLKIPPKTCCYNILAFKLELEQ